MTAVTQTAASFCSSVSRLDSSSSLDYRKKVCLALRAPAAALEVSALLNRKRHVVDVPVNLR